MKTGRRADGQAGKVILRILPSFRLSVLAAVISTAACATPGQVRRVETEIRDLRVETARRDSIRASALAGIIGLQQRIMDSLAAGREALRTLDARLGTDITEIQRQLLAVQELTGQSQRRLSELKAQVDARAEQNSAAGVPSAPAPAPASVPGDTTTRPAAPTMPTVTADQMYQGARQQLTRGAVTTARRGFQELLKSYPTSDLVPEATFFIGESFAVESPDSAVVYWSRVVSQYPRSGRAPTALYKMGRLEETRNNNAAARQYYERLLREFPRSDDVELARDRLKNLRP